MILWVNYDRNRFMQPVNRFFLFLICGLRNQILNPRSTQKHVQASIAFSTTLMLAKCYS